MKELQALTVEAWQDWVIRHADYWTAIRFKPRGQTERHEFPSREEAVEAAKLFTKQEPGTRYLIYAVAGVHDSYVETVA